MTKKLQHTKGRVGALIGEQKYTFNIGYGDGFTLSGKGEKESVT